MAPRKKVFSLRDLSLQAFGKSITTVAQTMFETADTTPNKLNVVKKLRFLLCNEVSSCLHDSIAQHFLEGLQKFYKTNFIPHSSESSSKCEVVVRNLALVIPHLKVKNICLGSWVEPIQSVLSQNLKKMISLETLSCNVSSERDEQSFEQILVAAIPFFSNLSSFVYVRYCSNNVLNKISEYCKSITIIAVRGSQSVTDDCIENLANCVELQSLMLLDTSITENGYMELVMKTKSRNLSEIFGFQIASDDLLSRKKNSLTPFRTFPLRELSFSEIACSLEQINLACKYFPHLRKLTVDHDGRFDLTALSTLENCKEFRLFATREFNYTYSLHKFLSIKGNLLTSLELFAIQGLAVEIISAIAIFCPNIEVLTFLASRFHDKHKTKLPKIESQAAPFQKLTQFMSFVGLSLPCLKFILQYARSISHLTLVACEPIKDEFFKDVLSVNALKSLSCLEIIGNNEEISTEMLKFIISNCDELTTLKNFLLNESDLKNVKDFIFFNNYDVNFNPKNQRQYISDILFKEALQTIYSED